MRVHLGRFKIGRPPAPSPLHSGVRATISTPTSPETTTIQGSDLYSKPPAHDAVRALIKCIGEDVNRPGLKETPNRVVKAFAEEWFIGYQQNAEKVIKQFEDGGEYYSGILFQGSIPVYSHCEHHITPFFGVAHFGYMPDKRIVGLSKIYRLIDVFARRLQVQERLSGQIVDTFMQHVPCSGCGLVLQMRHLCMESRGVRLPGTITTTSDFRGLFIKDPTVKQEFMDLVRMEKR